MTSKFDTVSLLLRVNRSDFLSCFDNNVFRNNALQY